MHGNVKDSFKNKNLAYLDQRFGLNYYGVVVCIINLISANINSNVNHKN